MKINFTALPCNLATAWLKKQPDIETAWQSCERGDWMWWALCHIEGALPEKKTSVAFARWCARHAKRYATATDADAAVDAASACASATVAAPTPEAAAATASAYAADACADAYTAKFAAQADWIRSHVPCPKEQP